MVVIDAVPPSFVALHIARTYRPNYPRLLPSDFSGMTITSPFTRNRKATPLSPLCQSIAHSSMYV